MIQNNIVNIGTALKWRDTFDSTKRYYRENIVTYWGCVFRCKVFLTQEVPPISIIDEEGHVGIADSDIWDVVLDMTYYINFVIDAKNLIRKTFEYIKKVEEDNQRQQEEIDAIKEDDKHQWVHINKAEENIQLHQAEISAIKEDDLNQWQYINDLADKYANLKEYCEDLNEVVVEQGNTIVDLQKQLISHNESIINLQNKLIEDEEQIANLKSSVAELQTKLNDQQQTIDNQQKIIEEQQKRIEELEKRPVKDELGLWRNDALWTNKKLWPNIWSEVREPLIESYDEENQTLYLNSRGNDEQRYSEPTQTLSIISEVPLILAYNEEEKTITI